METTEKTAGEKGFSFRVEGMSCASCVRLVERSLNKVEGIDYVSVNLATEKAYVLAQEDLPEKRIEEAVDRKSVV